MSVRAARPTHNDANMLSAFASVTRTLLLKKSTVQNAFLKPQSAPKPQQQQQPPQRSGGHSYARVRSTARESEMEDTDDSDDDTDVERSERRRFVHNNGSDGDVSDMAYETEYGGVWRQYPFIVMRMTTIILIARAFISTIVFATIASRNNEDDDKDINDGEHHNHYHRISCIAATLDFSITVVAPLVLLVCLRKKYQRDSFDGGGTGNDDDVDDSLGTRVNLILFEIVTLLYMRISAIAVRTVSIAIMVVLITFIKIHHMSAAFTDVTMAFVLFVVAVEIALDVALCITGNCVTVSDSQFTREFDTPPVFVVWDPTHATSYCV